jgi:hypothetical protein
MSAALTPMNCASWSITTTLSSASAGSALCWAYPDRRSITGRRRCVNPRCGLWPGSTRSTWMIPAVAADGWSSTWQQKGSRSAVTVSDSSCAAWVYGRSTGNPAPRFQAIHPRDSPAWWISGMSRRLIRCGPLTSPTSHCRKASCMWWRSWISTPGMFSAGSCPTALTRSFAWRLWRWPSSMAGDRRSSTPTKGASSPQLTSWASCRPRRSRSAGQEESAATTTSWSKGFGKPSKTRRCTSMPTAMAGRLRSAWPASCGGTAM